MLPQISLQTSVSSFSQKKLGSTCEDIDKIPKQCNLSVTVSCGENRAHA